MQAGITMAMAGDDTSIMSSANLMTPTRNDISRIMLDQLFDGIFPAHLVAQVNIFYDGIRQKLSMITDQSALQYEENTKARKVKKDDLLVDWLYQESVEILKK